MIHLEEMMEIKEILMEEMASVRELRKEIKEEAQRLQNKSPFIQNIS